MSMPKPWYRRWFGEQYKQLYPHRDLRQAEGQVGPLLELLPVTSAWRILDVGCGTGRHLEVMSSRGHKGLQGMDLSMSLLRDARRQGLPVARADMRHLPFKRAGFDLVTSFFTSFGYFATLEEDVETLAQFVSVVKPGGWLFLDLINPPPLINSLVPTDTKVVDGKTVEQSRRLEGDIVIKDIAIRHPDGTEEHFQERVRLHGLEAMLALGARFGLAHKATFGDESGGPWHPEASPRMALLFQFGGAC